MKKIAVGMSGGVDSTIAVHLLLQKGYEVVGVTMSIWDNSIDIPDLGKSGCYGPGEVKDIAFTKELAQKLGIKHYVIDLAKEYKENVLKYFCNEYLCGNTPNPCVKCNQKIKFGALLEKTKEVFDYDHFATGHYACVEFDSKTDRYLLKKAADDSKDQTYFLSHLNQQQLSKLMFPLGSFPKAEVKELARSLGLPEVADKTESQDFIETDDYSILFNPKDIKIGSIVDTTGKVLGKHRGIINYTVGQRKGLGLSGGHAESLYVLKIDSKNNTIVVGHEENLMCDTLYAKNVNWISVAAPTDGMKVMAKIRQQHKPAEAVLTVDAVSGDIIVKFTNAQRAITPGQTIVFYGGNNFDLVIGGGTITCSMQHPVQA